MDKLKNMLSSGNKEDETKLSSQEDSSLRRPGQIAGEGSHFGKSRNVAETPAGVAQSSETMPGSFGDDQPRPDSVTSPGLTGTAGTTAPATSVLKTGSATHEMPSTKTPLQSTTGSKTGPLASSGTTGAVNTSSLSSIATQGNTTHSSEVGKTSTAPQIPRQEFGDSTIPTHNIGGATATAPSSGAGAIGSDIGPRDTASTASIKSGVAGDTGLAHGHTAAASTTNRPGYATEGNLTGRDVVTSSSTAHSTGHSNVGVIPVAAGDTAAHSTTNRPGFVSGGDATGRDSAGTSTLPIRSGDGTHADIGQTYTARSFPLNATHEGPHETATANRLDPHVDATTGVATATTTGASSGTGLGGITGATDMKSHGGRDGAIAGTGATGAGLAGYETSKHHSSSTGPHATGVSTSDRVHDASTVSSTNPEKSHHYGRDAAIVGGTGATGAGAAHEYEKHRGATGSDRDPVVASHSGYTEHSRQPDTSHHGRDAAIGAAGAGTVGAGAYEYEKHSKTADAEREAQKSLGHSSKDSPDHHDRKTSGKENVGGVVGAGTVGSSALEAERDDKHSSKLQKKKDKEEDNDDAKKDKRKSGGILGFLHRDKNKDSDKDDTTHKTEDGSSSTKHHHGRETAAAGGAGAVGAGAAYEAGSHHHQTHPEPVGHDTGHQSSMFNTSTPHDRGSVATDNGYGGTIKRSPMDHDVTRDQTHTGSLGGPPNTGASAATGAATASPLTHGKGEVVNTADTGPASKTIGPHSSNVANVVDPRVQPDPALMKQHTTVGPHQSDTLNKLDPKVEADPQKAAEKERERTAAVAGGGALGATGGTAAATSGTERHTTSGASTDKHATFGSDTGKHATARDQATSSTTRHQPETEYERIGGVPDTRTGRTDRTDEYAEGKEYGRDNLSQRHETSEEYGRASGEQQHERSGLSKLLHRDNPNKLHKDPPAEKH